MTGKLLNTVAVALIYAIWPVAAAHAQRPLRDWFDGSEQPTSDGSSFLQTDGPTFTRANTTVPQGMVQLESRYLFSRRPAVYSGPQLDLRIGVLPRVELRAEWAGVDLGSTFRSSEDFELGFKFEATKAAGWIPQSAFLAEILTPTGYGPNAIGKVAPEFDYIFGWSITEALGFGGSTGVIFGQPGASHVTEFYQSLLVNRRWLDGHLVTFCESYSLFGNGTNQAAVLPSVNSGVLWRPGYNLQFDWHAGFGLNRQAPGFSTGVGICFRF